MEKTIDNFDLLAHELFKEPLAPDEFYFLQVLVRGKDGNDVHGNNKNRLVKMYCIRSAESLMALRDEIVALCRVNNARAYINPTRRSDRMVANEVLLLTAQYTVNGNWSAFRSMYATACGKSSVASDKKFIVDLDDLQPTDERFGAVERYIYEARGHGGPRSEKVVMRVPTASGWHLVTRPFELAGFQERFPGIDVHRNNPTLLYLEKRK